MEVINKIQKSVLRIIGEVPDNGHFYLTGGTALSNFYLKHRKSNDLDFFTTVEEIIVPFSRHLEEKLIKEGMSVKRQRSLHSFVELFVEYQNEATLVHLAQDAAFRFEPTRQFPEYPKLKVDSLVDVASNKLLALFGRASLRDFIDIYFLVNKSPFTIDALIDKAKKKDPGFDLYWLGVALEQIKTFKDDSPEMLLLLEPVKFSELLAFFNSWREEIAGMLK